jgi:hypothetical protein
VLISEINNLKRYIKSIEKFNHIELIIQRLNDVRDISKGFYKNIKEFQLVFENSVEINREIIGIERNI